MKIQTLRGGKIDAISLAAGVVGGLLAGGGAGYFLCRRHLAASYAERLDAEVATIKADYNDRLKGSYRQLGTPFAGPTDGDLAGESDHTDYRKAAVGTDDPGIQPGDVAIDPEEGLPSENELAVREAEAAEQNLFVNEAKPSRSGKPRRISAEAFAEAPPESANITITYYAADKVLVDDHDQPIQNIGRTVGKLDALSFGGISGDPHICYVHNPELDVFFEIVLDNRSYAEVVLNYGRPV
jgi:hypothetical protein